MQIEGLRAELEAEELELTHLVSDEADSLRQQSENRLELTRSRRGKV
jgi:hypothetical protein